MSEETEFDIEAEKALASKDLAYTLYFSLAVIEEPTLLEDVPNGVLLVLMPDDDPEYTAISVERGMKAVARGQDVYFRRFPHNDVERRVFEREAPNWAVRTSVAR